MHVTLVDWTRELTTEISDIIDDTIDDAIRQANRRGVPLQQVFDSARWQREVDERIRPEVQRIAREAVREYDADVNVSLIEAALFAEADQILAAKAHRGDWLAVSRHQLCHR